MDDGEALDMAEAIVLSMQGELPQSHTHVFL